MAKYRFNDLRRDYYLEGTTLIDLEIFFNRYNISKHIVTHLFRPNQRTVKKPIRLIGSSCFWNGALDYSPDFVKDVVYYEPTLDKHRLDESCVVIPSRRKFVGGIRFVPDNVPSVVGQRMMYMRCPSPMIAVSLSIWLRNPRVINAISNEMTAYNKNVVDWDLINRVPIPEDMLSPSILLRAMELEDSLVEKSKEIAKVVKEIREITWSKS